MKKLRLLLLWTALLLTFTSLVMAQGGGPTDAPPAFAPLTEIGRPHPYGVLYDPHFDQMVMVDPAGQLLLVDAATFQTRYVLYEEGLYSAYTFSHDGRWLALAIDRRVEVWDTQAGTINVDVEIEDALSLQAPLQFSDDDNLLLINALIPAPADIRRSENDTANLPYLWDLPAARNEALTTLPHSLDLISFYDYLNGFVLGPQRKVIAALPSRLQVIDVADKTLPVVTEIASDRHERDPISVWYSLRDEQIYALANQGGSDLMQIDSETGAQFTIPMSRTLSSSQTKAMETLILSNQARIIGEPHSRSENSLLRALLGEDYPANWSYHPLTVILLDILQPITMGEDQMGLLIYIRDDETGLSTIELVRPAEAQQMTLHPDNTHLAVRQEQLISVYNLDTGVLELAINPAVTSDPVLLAYNAAGDALLCDYQRFDAQTGALLFDDPNWDIAYVDDFFFTMDSRYLITLSGADWWVWDVNTGEVVRRERVHLTGMQLDMSPDANRYLTQIDTVQGSGIEVINVGTEERHSVVFESLPDRSINQIIPSPNWEHFLVIYSPIQADANGDIALYSLYDGKLWYIANDDLPGLGGRSYGWLDNETAYVSGENGGNQPERLYGIDYDPSGLPACLVQSFPDQWTSWLDLWERLNAWRTPEELGMLAQQLCAVLPGTVDDVNAVFFPSPTPTLPYMTATPAAIADVPSCLTQRFPDEAQQYAALWRQISAGMTPEQMADLEVLLCEGLNGATILENYNEGGGYSSNLQVMTIDVNSGKRWVGGYMPSTTTQETAPTRSLDLVLQALRRQNGLQPYNAALSPSGTLLAAQIDDNRITIYQLVTPYETLAANATATAAPFVTEQPHMISVQPTATQPFDPIGGPRPTLTPTITPTAPPRAETIAALPDYGKVQDVSLSTAVAPLDNPPLGYSPSGDLIVGVYNDERLWVLNPANGDLWPEDRLPKCLWLSSCSFSFDQNWIEWQRDNGDLVLSRTDGSDLRVLFDAVEIFPDGFQWLGLHTLEYSYLDYLPDQYRDPVRLIQQIDPLNTTTPEPFQPSDSISVNQLPTDVVAAQPDRGPFALVSTSFNTGNGTGHKYYIFNRTTNTATYFARLTEGTLEAEWHPLGRVLYYRYPDAEQWYVFDPATQEHRVLGDLPSGLWSRDGRYRAEWITLSPDEQEPYVDAGLPYPKLRIWDSETGQMRRYAIPSVGGVKALNWSPDSRYLAFNTIYPNETQTPLHLIILDVETGSLTEVKTMREIGIITWAEQVPERGR